MRKNTKLVSKTLAAAFVFTTVSATSVMANDGMHCMTDKGQDMSKNVTKAECDKMGGTMMNDKDMMIKQDKIKEDKMMKEDRAKEDKMVKDDRMKEDKMK